MLYGIVTRFCNYFRILLRRTRVMILFYPTRVMNNSVVVVVVVVAADGDDDVDNGDNDTR